MLRKACRAKPNLGLQRLTWSILRDNHRSMIQPDIRCGRRALIGQSVVLLHLKGHTARALPIAGAGGAVWAAGGALHCGGLTAGLCLWRLC